MTTSNIALHLWFLHPRIQSTGNWKHRGHPQLSHADHTQSNLKTPGTDFICSEHPETSRLLPRQHSRAPITCHLHHPRDYEWLKNDLMYVGGRVWAICKEEGLFRKGLKQVSLFSEALETSSPVPRERPGKLSTCLHLHTTILSTG